MSLFNLTRLPHTTCTASSTYPDYPCTLAIDGLVADNKQWTSMGEKDGAWINIIFPGPVLIKTIKIWPRCALYDQFRTLVFEFSDGSHAKITAHCSTNRDFRNCDDPDLLISFDLTAYVVTKWVKLTGYDSCDPTTGNNGFMELIYLGMVLFD
ncbi:hypothetical protein LSH36_32g05068 [Paralvinella palmiformis]|uniref:DUF7402 domain-containing protein n=1 Tax=Paralvinella palmiformis TaxID=53620 RepID=A0AAD9NH72_9ANNE|nr:hypothetical protein LSH36_32g05068 [Paralvinella palmiformis]